MRVPAASPASASNSPGCRSTDHRRSRPRRSCCDGDTHDDAGPSVAAWIEIATRTGPLAVAGAYLSHGIEHILLGYDHLLFVLALILIVRNTRMLVWTITAFTLAHSITLSLATLGVVHVPGPPVEAMHCPVASCLLASEIVRLRRGQPSFTASWPWAVAFTFGLLHGLRLRRGADRRSACRKATFRSRYSRSMSASKSDNLHSSRQC